MATLTQQEFLAIADLYPEGINLWCTDSAPISVLGVTVPFIDNEGHNVRDTLSQIQTITLPVDNDAETTVELVITSRVIRGISPRMYYFFKVESKDINTYVNPVENEIVVNADVLLLPSIQGGVFYGGNYDITVNTAQNSRTSEYIMKSTSTTFADVQDSLYSNTGWINARYVGTPTNALSYVGIDSALRGSSIQATYYPIQTPDTEINNVDTSERSYKEYFHTGPQTYPSYSIETPDLFFNNPGIFPTDTVITLYPTSSNIPIKLYEPGDLIKALNSSEIIKVKTMERLTSNNDYRVEVIRGWNGTTPGEYIPTTKFYKINSTRVFELEKSKPSAVRQGKLRLKDTGYIVYLDALGYIVSGSNPTV